MEKMFPRFVLAVLLAVSIPSFISAADLGPGYSESVQMAIDHAATPANWRTQSLVVIPDVPGTAGLTYDGGSLIVRTATKARNFQSTYVGKPGYTIFGPPTTEASWVTTGNDATRFLLANGVSGANATTLIERGLGMAATGTHDAIVEFAVDTQRLMRPTRNPDISRYLPEQYGTNLPFVKPAGMSDAAFENFKAYYVNWMAGAYGAFPFPWTQLGYTFFWGNGTSLANINGMSEFILLGGSPAGIYGVYATQSYIYTRNDGAGFSSAPTAQFGNGYASFRIDGACDTVWAGHAFQRNVRTDAATPNKIIVTPDGSVTGGQGILVWSLNYDVENSGAIGGATADKFGITGTSDIAVLFRGDTSIDRGTPVLNGINRLVNSGAITSPGTAVKAEAGNTLITNNTGGIISGGVYAIQTGGGNDTVTVNGGEIKGKIDLGGGTNAFAVTGASAAKLSLTLNRDAAGTASVANAGTASIANNTTVAVAVSPTSNIRSRDKFVIVDATTLAVDPANLAIRNDPAIPMVNFSALKDGNRLLLEASRDGSYYRLNSGNPSLGAVLDTLAGSATGEMATVLGALDASGNAGNARQLQPASDDGLMQAAYGTSHQITRTIMGRIDQVLLDRRAGIGGGPGRDGGVWGQGFGTAMDQAAKGTSGGFNARIRGASVGFDRFVYDHVMAGLSGAYARSDIRSGDSNTSTDADSYQGSLYGSLARDAYYVNGVLSYAYNRYDTLRHIAFGSIDRIAKSTYGGEQYTGYLEGGYTFRMRGLALTPLASLQYQRLHLNDYAEAGAGSLNLAVDGQDYHMFQSGLGAKLAYPVPYGGVQIVPELHAKWLYDFVGDPQQITATFGGGGASFVTRGFEPPKSSYNIGARLAFLAKNDVTLSLNYDFEMKEDFSSHSGYVMIRYAF